VPHSVDDVAIACPRRDAIEAQSDRRRDRDSYEKVTVSGALDEVVFLINSIDSSPRDVTG
jgi:hypothetical protein